MINLVSTVIQISFLHVHETSPGKSTSFPSIYLLHLLCLFRIAIGLCFVMQTHPQT